MIKKRAIHVLSPQLFVEGEQNSSETDIEFMTLDDAVDQLIEEFDDEIDSKMFTEKDRYDLFENCAKNIHDLFFEKFNFSKNGNVMLFEAVPVDVSEYDGLKFKEPYITNKYSFSVFGRDIENLIFRNLEFYTKDESNKLKAVFEPNYILMKHLLRNGIMSLKVTSEKDRRNSSDNVVSSGELFNISFIDVRNFLEYNKRIFWNIKDEIEYKLSNGYYKD